MDAKPAVGDQVVTAHEQDGNTLLHYYQDVEPHIEYAAKCRREDAERRGAFGKRQEFRRTMAVPFNVILKICNETGLNFFEPEDAKHILRILKNPDYRAFRTTTDKNI